MKNVSVIFVGYELLKQRARKGQYLCTIHRSVGTDY